MTNRREYPAATYVTLRERYAVGDTSIRRLAEEFGMPVGTVQNIVSGRKKPMSPEAIARRAERARRVSALGGEAVRRQHVEQRPPTGVVAAAIAERNTGKPLVVETLEAKLATAIPGAEVLGRWEDWLVYDRAGRLIATGHSKREAVARAISLRGGR